ncbi:hypothetical protein IWX47DRAFT_477353 [Phyllosticta citricarpa]
MHAIAATIVRDGLFTTKTQGELGAGICLFRIDIPQSFSPLVLSSLAHEQKKIDSPLFFTPVSFSTTTGHDGEGFGFASTNINGGARTFLFHGTRKGKAGKTHETKLGSGCWGCGTNWSWSGACTRAVRETIGIPYLFFFSFLFFFFFWARFGRCFFEPCYFPTFDVGAGANDFSLVFFFIIHVGVVPFYHYPYYLICLPTYLPYLLVSLSVYRSPPFSPLLIESASPHTRVMDGRFFSQSFGLA